MTDGKARGGREWFVPVAVVSLLACALLWTDGGASTGKDTERLLQERGRLDGAPQAILPAAAGSVDLACALVPPERIAALPEAALRYSGLRDPESPYLARPRFDLYEAERILKAAPDLVLAHPWQNPDTTERLREAGVDVLVLPDPKNWPGVAEQIHQLGVRLGAEAAASDLLERCEVQLAGIREEASARKPLTVLAYNHGGTGGLVAGAGTTHDEVFRLAGLRNLAPRPGHAAMSFEELLMLDPDVLVISQSGLQSARGGTLSVLRSEPALAGLGAVVDDQIVVLDAWLYTTLSHHILDAAEEVLQQSSGWSPRERAPR
jgi:ABC-type Fe3+-hydroxamate transport system substrate-binding protein